MPSAAADSASLTVRFAGPRQVDVVRSPPEELRPGHVRVRTLYSGISAGTELTAYRGSNVYLNKQWDPESRLFMAGAQGVEYPLSGWGYSEVGEVVEVGLNDPTEGARVDRSRPVQEGERVYGIWGHRAEAVVPAASLAGHQLPEGLDPLAGVFARVGAVALNAVLAADIRITESLVITGQGVIGLLATRIAALSGARVIAVDRSPMRLTMATRFGASSILDATRVDVAPAVRELTAGVGADAVIELSGAYPALRDAIRAVRPGGRIAAAGFYQGAATALDLGEEFHHNRVALIASQIGGVPGPLHDRWDRSRLDRAVMELISSGAVEVGPLVSHVVPVAEAAAAYQLLDADDGQCLQVVLDFRPPATARLSAEGP